VRRLVLALIAFGFAAGCRSTLQVPDGAAGGRGGSNNAGNGGNGGTAGAGGGCLVNGVLHPEGSDFPCSSSDPCPPCTCLGGEVAIYTVGCVHYDAGLGRICEVDRTYSYGDTGGLVASESTTTLSPPSSWTRTRTSRVTDPASATCTVRLLCAIDGERTLIEIEQIKTDLAQADVQAALAQATPPIYGGDARPVDGTIFQFLRDDGRGFLAGGPCGGAASCVDVPAGIAALVADLRALDARQLMDPACAALR
jgi:hypothetical protein